MGLRLWYVMRHSAWSRQHLCYRQYIAYCLLSVLVQFVFSSLSGSDRVLQRLEDMLDDVVVHQFAHESFESSELGCELFVGAK